MRPSKIFALVFSSILLLSSGHLAKADTFFSINGAGVNGQEAITFSIPSSATPDFLSGNSFSFSNVPITLLFGYGPEPPAGSVAPGTISFSDNGGFQYFSVTSAVVPDVSGEYTSPLFFTVNSGNVSFISGQYGFIGIGTSFFMDVTADDPPTSPVPEPSSLVLMATGALYFLKSRFDKRRLHTNPLRA